MRRRHVSAGPVRLGTALLTCVVAACGSEILLIDPQR